MVNTSDAPFNQRPKAFNGISMSSTFNENFLGVINNLMIKPFISKRIIGTHFIGVNGSTARDLVSNNRHEGIPVSSGDDFGSNLTMTFYNAKHGGFISRATSGKFIPFRHVHIDSLTADIRFIQFNLTRMSKCFTQQCANLFEHAPCCFIGNTSFSLDLFSGDTAASRGHAIDNLKPYFKWGSGVVEYRINKRVNLMPTIIAFIASSTYYPMMLCYLVTNRTRNTFWVTMVFNPLQALLISPKFLTILYTIIVAQKVHVVKG
jgi:hypothetical protein